MGHRVTNRQFLKPFNGVVYHPEREQPYTVWVNSKVVCFCYDQVVAYKVYYYEKEKQRLEVYAA